MFKVFINDGMTQPPQDDIFYIIGKNGIFLRKKLGLIDAIIPVDSISILGDITPEARYDLPKIPVSIFSKVVAFFRKVYDDLKSEAVVVLHFNEEKGYKVQIPHQTVSGSSLNYIKTVTYPGYTKIGTIHSHAGMSAFHSGVDDKDEEDVDGLHITVGHLDWDDWNFDLSCSIVFNGHRFMIEPTDYIDRLNVIEMEVPKYSYSYSWLKYYKGTTYNDDNIKTEKKFGYNLDVRPSKMKFDSRWMNYVSKAKPRILTFGSGYTSSHYRKNQTIINKTYSPPINSSNIINKIEDGYNPCETCIFSEYKFLKEIEDDGYEVDGIEVYDDNEIDETTLFDPYKEDNNFTEISDSENDEGKTNEDE